MDDLSTKVAVYIDEKLSQYGFGPQHPFSNDRLPAFRQAFFDQRLDEKVLTPEAVMATVEQVARFHTLDYIQTVQNLSETGSGYFDTGDTPVIKGIYQASLYVVGSALDALDQICQGHIQHAFLPVGGLHHAHPGHASGFCIFNDCGIVIKTLRQTYGIEKVAYIDIDAHHGDGVFYAFKDDPNLIFADIHQAGIFPGTGHPSEKGEENLKLNIALPEGAEDELFFQAWTEVEALLNQTKPEFILLQCGADSLKNDPLTGLCYTEHVHGHTASQAKHFADKYAKGRLIAFGGGGYNLQNLGKAWTAVVQNLL